MTNMSEGFTVRLCENDGDVDEAKKIRYQVFIVEQGYAPEVETADKDDPLSTLWLICSPDGQAIGTIRLKNETNQLGRFAILPDYRGRGLGKLLLDALHLHAKRKSGLSRIWCEVQADTRPGKVDARKPYVQAGYTPYGELWDKFGGYHQNMKLDLDKVNQ